MGAVTSSFSEKSRLAALLEHFSQIEDPRDPWRVAHPLPEVLLLAVCGTIADCDDYDHIAAWGEAHLAFLRRFLPYHHGVPGGRWLTKGDSQKAETDDLPADQSGQRPDRPQEIGRAHL